MAAAAAGRGTHDTPRCRIIDANRRVCFFVRISRNWSCSFCRSSADKMHLRGADLSSFLAYHMPRFPPSAVKLGLASAGFGLAYLVFKEFRLALRSMPDETSKSHGGEVVAKVLHAHGVKHIFTLIGGHISPILVASKKLGITVIDFRHEVNCVFAADAMSRLTGITGVAAVTAGPGVTNTITAVKNAQMAQSPLVLIGGAAPTILKVRR